MSNDRRPVDASGVPLPWYSIWAATAPDAPALVGGRKALSYGDLEERTAVPPSPGPRLVLDGPPSEDWVIALLSGLRDGREIVLPDAAWAEGRREEALALLGAPRGEAGVWLFTSGTTSSPRPCFRSAATLVAMVERVRRRLPESLARPTAFSLAPLDHGFGLMNGLFLIHALGGAVVLAGGRDPLDVIRSHSVRVLFGWPHHYRRLLEAGLDAGTSLRWCVSSAVGLDRVTAEAFAQRAGVSLRQQYGTTEAGPLCLDAEEPPHPDPSCVGRPLDGVQVLVVDRTGRPLPAGERGEIAVRIGGDLSRTGDLGARDERGRVHVFGRAQPFSDERRDPAIDAAWDRTMLSDALPGWSDRVPARRKLVLGVLPGEGVGPEVIAAALAVLEAASRRFGFAVDVRTGGAIGGAALRASGSALTPEVAAFCEGVFGEGGAVLCGPGEGRFVYDLRERFGLYCKLTPVKGMPSLDDVGPLRPAARAGVDVLVVRENLGGIYFGEWGTSRGGEAAHHRHTYDEFQVARILSVAVRAAESRRGRLCLVLKPGGLPSISDLWLRGLEKESAGRRIETAMLEVDNASYQLIANAATFDVVVAPNLFGDILSDCAALLLGSRGLSFSGNFGAPGVAVYQTGHGAAGDLAGSDRANPLGQIFSLAMLLRESFKKTEAAAAIEAAIARTVASGARTADISPPGRRTLGTQEMGARVAQAVEDPER